MELVLDTSALLAVLAHQPERTVLLRLSKGAALVAPASLNWEIGNALSAMFKRRTIALNQALKLLNAYRQVSIRLVTPSLEQAVELSSSLNIYAYDAYVIACAINQRAPILSLDRGLIESAKSIGIDCLEVEIS